MDSVEEESVAGVELPPCTDLQRVSYLCPVGGFRFFPGMWCEDSWEVHPGSRGSHQMEERADCLARRCWGNCEKNAAEPTSGSHYWFTTGSHINYNWLWRPRNGAADPDLYCASNHVNNMWERAFRNTHECIIHIQSLVKRSTDHTQSLTSNHAHFEKLTAKKVTAVSE